MHLRGARPPGRRMMRRCVIFNPEREELCLLGGSRPDNLLQLPFWFLQVQMQLTSISKRFGQHGHTDERRQGAGVRRHVRQGGRDSEMGTGYLRADQVCVVVGFRS